MQKNWLRRLTTSLGLISCCLPLWTVAQSTTLFAQVNSGYDELSPVLSPDGEFLYFVRNGHPNNIGFDNLPDIWLSRRKTDGDWGPSVHMGMPINDLKSNLLAGMNTDGGALYLAETDGLQSWLTATYRQGRHWSPPQSTIIERFIPGEGASFSVSPDEQFLLIASQQPEGLGSLDLYVAFRLEDRLWSRPLHLGPALNTPGKEAWAMIAADGQTLYFASDGRRGGAGGLDLWMSRRKDADWQEWTPPVNLGPAVNSPADETSLAIAGEGSAAIIARAVDGKQYDLQQVRLDADKRPFPIAILSGRLLDASTEQARPGEVSYRFLGAAGANEQRLRLQEDGRYQVIVPLNQSIAFYANLPGFLPLSEHFDRRPPVGALDTPNPTIAALAGVNAQYWQEEKIIHEMQDQLQLILEERDVLAREKKTHSLLLAEKTFEELETENVFFLDPEIEALERRFNIYQRRLRDTLSLLGDRNRQLLPAQPKGASAGDSKIDYIEEPSDEATVKLKNQLREYRPDAAASEMNAGGEDLPGAAESFSFQDLKRRAEKEATYALLPRVQAELVQELFPLIWREIQQTTNSTIFINLVEKEDSIRTGIRDGLGQFILAPDPFLSSAPEEEHEWWQQLKTDLKNIIRPHIRTQLKQNLRPYVLKAIQIELGYQITRSMEENRRKALNEKIELQRKIETAGFPPDKVSPGLAPEAPEDTLNNLMLVEKNFLLAPIEEGRILELKNVRFLPDESILAADSYAELDSIARFLKDEEKIRVGIRVHTHGWCDHAKANDLTQARARLLRDYFVAQGVPAERLEYQGLGKMQPVADNGALVGRAANQRIELKILYIDQLKTK